MSQAIGGRAPSLSDRGAPGRPEPSAGSFTGQGSGSARRPPRASQNSSEDGAPQDAAALGRRSRKTDRAHALSERIMPQRCGFGFVCLHQCSTLSVDKHFCALCDCSTA